MYFNKIILLLFLVVMLNSHLILAENSEKQTVKNQKENDSDTNVSQEDLEIIEDLEMLENLDMFQSEDIDFLNDYDTISEDINNEVKTDE
jgi:uncharacterized protein YpmB